MVDADNIVYIGKKPFMNYVTAVMMQFKEDRTNEVLIRARGKMINRAIDVALVSIDRFLENTVEVTDVKIESETMKDEDKETKVSCIDILMTKK